MNSNDVIKEAMDKMIDNIRMHRENEFSGNKEYREANRQLSQCIEKIKVLLPDDKHDLLQELDSVQTELLVAAGDYLYEAGFWDSIKVVKQLVMNSFL